MRLSFFVLAVQIVLTIFAPPVGVGARRIYFGDLWCMIWALLGGIEIFNEYLRHSHKRRSLRPYVRTLLASALILGITYAHGMFRVSLADLFSNLPLKLHESDAFLPARELVIYLRFLSWAWAAVVVYYRCRHKLSARDLSTLLNNLWTVLTAVMLAEGLIIILAVFYPGLQTLLGHLYHYDPNFFWWLGRAYGTLPSPIEAGLTLTLGMQLLLMRRRMEPRRAYNYYLFNALAIAATGIALLLTRTATPVLAVFLIALAWVITQLVKKHQSLRWSLPVFSAILCLAVIAASRQVPFIQLKIADFLSRFSTWGVYLTGSKIRWDFPLFGFGFSTQHADSLYLFLYNRGGVLLLASFLYAAYLALSTNWKRWNWLQLSIPLMLLISGLTLDSLIQRSTAQLFVTFGILALI